MTSRMIHKLKERFGYYDYQYARHQGIYGGLGFWALWESIDGWLAMRPRLVRCSHCGDRLWWYGIVPYEVYCSESCAYYGPATICPDCGKPVRFSRHEKCEPPF